MTADAAADVADRYARFADDARGRSALYEEWARGVVRHDAVRAIIARIPADRRQAPLVFAVTRLLGAPEADFAAWAEWLVAHADAVVAECTRRSLQTNEPLRCAALLPALSLVDGPIALIEVGASAGLCLYPDHYSYRYRGPGGVTALDPADGPSTVVLSSDLTADDDRMPPLRLPEIVWRAGVDLDPLGAGDPDDRRFLTTLVWPGEEGRIERIEAALDIVAADPPLLVRADATAEGVIASLAAPAPRDATLVVTTPGVLPHIPRAGRVRLARAIDALGARWITIDPPALHADLAAIVRPGGSPIDPGVWDAFVLALDGVPLASVDPLGASVAWRPVAGRSST
ncbi:DUF2332 family protein [Microbacterium immunditiarum]|uniref:DUF2332 domain-containing protein n=1 Tax=Microbacterium immunditiarum TaxID=337480 RepID=A0A7Y9KJ98_9MICO|nr:hypothetical protein [Microbacterium immunditiarum]